MATTNSSSSRPNLPKFIAYLVRDREDKPSFWTRIGGAWEHSDGQGLTLQLSVVPLQGRITLRVPSDKKKS